MDNPSSTSIKSSLNRKVAGFSETLDPKILDSLTEDEFAEAIKSLNETLQTRGRLQNANEEPVSPVIISSESPATTKEFATDFSCYTIPEASDEEESDSDSETEMNTSEDEMEATIKRGAEKAKEAKNESKYGPKKSLFLNVNHFSARKMVENFDILDYKSKSDLFPFK